MRGERRQPSCHLQHQPASYLGHRDQVARLFHYDRRRPLAITKLGLTARLPPARELDGVTVHSITYASPKGGEVPALVVVPKGKGPFPGVIVQHGLPDTNEGMLPGGDRPGLHPGRWPC